MDTPKPPSGQDIWRAVREELTANLYRLPFSTLAPTVYHVYLHREDFETIQGIVPRIVQEISSALTRDVERLNQESAPRGLLHSMLRRADEDPPIDVPDGWEIHIQPDQDDELARGSLGIVSKLSVPEPREYVGPPTVRTVKTIVAEGRRISTVIDAPQPTGAASASGSGSNVGSPSTTRRSSTLRATLSYADDRGPQWFRMYGDKIAIGRGGSSAWVDVQVMTSSKVSREHCRIRCDGSGRFFICDVSVWGASVNGQVLPPAVRSAEGTVSEPGAETELPATARIALADALVIEFRAEGPS